MGAVELKTEIGKVLDTLPEDALESVLNYLRSINPAKPENLVLLDNIKRILSEDKELLQKLAQ